MRIRDRADPSHLYTQQTSQSTALQTPRKRTAQALKADRFFSVF